MGELISVIIPIYNTEPSVLDFCLSCVERQTHKNIEVLCIDGGSKKDTIEIIMKYCKNDKRFLLIATQKGVSNQRNVGIKKSKGDFVAFIDSDDYFGVDYLSLLYSAVVQSSADIAIPRIQRTVYKNNSIVERDLYNVIQIPTNVTINNYFEFSRSGELVNPIKLYKKTLIDNTTFRLDMSYGEDLVFNYELAKKTYKTIFVNDALYYYRVNQDNNSQRRRLDMNGLRIVQYLYNAYKKADKKYIHNADGLYDEFLLVFKSFYYVAAREKKYRYLLWLNKYKTLYLKKNHNVHDIMYMLFPVLIVKRRIRRK